MRSQEAKQPTSSASSADSEMALQSIDRLKLILVWDDLGRIPNGGAFHAELDVLFKRVAALASAIVPQVVQAPIDVPSYLHTYFSDDCGDGIDFVHPTYGAGVFFTENCRHTPHENKPIAAPIVSTPKD